MYNFKVNNEEVWFYFNEEADEEHSSTINLGRKMNKFIVEF